MLSARKEKNIFFFPEIMILNQDWLWLSSQVMYGWCFLKALCQNLFYTVNQPTTVWQHNFYPGSKQTEGGSSRTQKKQKVVDKWIAALWNSLLKDVINAQSYKVSATIKSTWKRLPVGLIKSKYAISEKKVSWKLLETLFGRGRKEGNVRMFAQFLLLQGICF